MKKFGKGAFLIAGMTLMYAAMDRTTRERVGGKSTRSGSGWRSRAPFSSSLASSSRRHRKYGDACCPQAFGVQLRRKG